MKTNKYSKDMLRKVSLVVVTVTFFGVILFSLVSAKKGDGGSKCEDTSCVPAPFGQECEPKYGENGDECCPVWHCPNGQTSYGMSKSASGDGYSSSSSSSSSGDGKGRPIALQFHFPFG